MRLLVIGPAEMRAIAKLQAHAIANPLGVDLLKMITAGNSPMIAYHQRRFHLEIPTGFPVRFFIEQQPAGWVKHLAILISPPDENASQAVGILEAFRIGERFEDCTVWRQPAPEGGFVQHIIEPILDPVLIAALDQRVKV